MAISTRIWALKKYSAAMNNLDMAASNLLDVSGEYGERFPKVAENIDMIIDSLKVIHESIDILKKDI